MTKARARVTEQLEDLAQRMADGFAAQERQRKQDLDASTRNERAGICVFLLGVVLSVAANLIA